LARYNEILVGRYNRYLQKLLGMKGSPPSPQVASDIQPSLAIMEGVENRYLQSWERFANVQIMAATAANNAAVRMRNPAASNVVAVLEKLLVVNANALSVQPQLEQAVVDPGDLTTLVGSSPAVDSRQRPKSTCILSQQSAVSAPALGFTFSRVFLTQTITTYDFILDADQELTLLPGTAIQVRDFVVNTAVQVAWLWRERALEESERS